MRTLSRTIRLAAFLAVLAPMGLWAQAPLRPADLAFWRLSGRPDSATVVKLLGPADSVAEGDDPSQADSTLPTWWYGDLQVVIVGGLVLGQWTNGKEYPSYRGVRIGDSTDRIIAAYGRPSRTWSDPGGLVYTDSTPSADDRVLYFEVREGRVHRIYIGYLVD
jgi:hypothetical protein